MLFKEYQHIERFGNDEVQGIELGECYVFPKLDGTNASVWLAVDGICSGSRKRELTIEADNAGFHHWVCSDGKIADFFIGRERNKGLRLYGEWLVPHSLKTYREDVWRRFWIFDVYDDQAQKYLHYNEYQPLLEEAGLDYVTPLCVIKNATYDNLLVELENNRFLVREGEGPGEGIVIKNYLFQNRFGCTVWAKIVTNEFKEKHVKVMGPTVKNMKEMTEQVIAQEYITKPLVDKTYAKIANENDGWNSRYIPQLLSRVYHDLVTEEMWDIVKKFKSPTINFKTLNTLSVMRIKELRPELF